MDYTFSKSAVNIKKLQYELSAYEIEGISSVGESVIIHSTVELSQENLQAIGAIIEAHDPFDQISHVNSIIADARSFGYQLILKFAKDNILMGITQTGKTATIAMYLHKLEHFLTTGSLYAAISEIDNILADEDKQHLEPFVANERLQAYKDEILQYLGL
jgi:hypothetical protein